MQIYKIVSVDDALTDACRRLIPQLSPNADIPSVSDLTRIVGKDCVSLFAAGEEGVIYGLLTLTVYETPSGVKALIDDVVVDASRRGCGIGRMLVAHALEYAAEVGVRVVSLTSGRHREAAHRLYLAMGFTEPESKLFRMYFHHARL